MSFIGAHNPRILSTATVAKWVNTHAARARQIVSQLVKAGLLESSRGGGGGVRPEDPRLGRARRAALTAAQRGSCFIDCAWRASDTATTAVSQQRPPQTRGSTPGSNLARNDLFVYIVRINLRDDHALYLGH